MKFSQFYWLISHQVESIWFLTYHVTLEKLTNKSIASDAYWSCMNVLTTRFSPERERERDGGEERCDTWKFNNVVSRTAPESRINSMFVDICTIRKWHIQFYFRFARHFSWIFRSFSYDCWSVSKLLTDIRGIVHYNKLALVDASWVERQTFTNTELIIRHWICHRVPDT